jgi:hypothetical protein
MELEVFVRDVGDKPDVEVDMRQAGGPGRKAVARCLDHGEREATITHFCKHFLTAVDSGVV